jgi:class 3 adenylate cyclase
MPDRHQIDALIATLEQQRASLGNAAVDFALAAVREKLAAAPVAPAQPKLRQVSVLFCDIAGSTAMLQRLAAEDALAVTSAALQAFAGLITAFGGAPTGSPMRITRSKRPNNSCWRAPVWPSTRCVWTSPIARCCTGSTNASASGSVPA